MNEPEGYQRIFALMVKLSDVSAIRKQEEWQSGDSVRLPDPTNPEAPQSMAEEEVILELTAPEGLDELREYVRYIRANGPLNPTAEWFFEALLRTAEKRERGFE